MAASSKFDLSSSSSDGPPVHSSGQRLTASLERPGSFREAAENRIASSLSVGSASRAGSVSSQGETVNLLQSLVSDMKTVMGFDQKLSRPGELRRSIGSILGVSQEDTLPATFSMRPLPSSSVEEIRRLKNNLHEGSAKASDRAKAFGEAALKMDKCYNNLSRKRSRPDISTSGRSNAGVPGGSTPKMGPQNHFTSGSLEGGPQKTEERAKIGAPSRKIRSSLLEMDARSNSIARPSSSIDRERDALKITNGGATPPEEKGRPLAATVDTWEKSKMKKKRSVIKSDASGNVVLARPHDGERELKRGMQQKLMTEARPRSNNAHSFRPNAREEVYAASPTSMVKMNTSVRGPRSNPGTLSKTASPNRNRGMGSSDDWEHPNSLNKVNGIAGAVNRKRSASARSSSPPVAHWGGQRLQKMTRVARRSNLPPVGSTRDDFPASDMQDPAAVDDGLGYGRRSSINASQQSKSRGDLVLSSGLSESEDSGVVENKAKDKSKKATEIDEKAGVNIQKAAALVLPSRKSKVITEEDQEEGIRKHGKISRGAIPARSIAPASNEKLDGIATAKQMRSARINLEKSESKPGRPLTKKWSERKGHTRPRHSAAGAAVEFPGESDDDHDELLAAASAALNTSQGLNTFWEQMEEILGFLSAEDEEFLKQQIRLSDEAAASVCSSGDGKSLKCDLGHSSGPSTPSLSTKDGSDGSPNGSISLSDCMRAIDPASHLMHAEPFLEDLAFGNGAQTGVSICQALLSAIIEEDELEKFNLTNNDEEEHMHGNVFELRPYKASVGWGYDDELIDGRGSNGFFDELAPNSTVTSSPTCTEFQYNQMCINDRILMELSEIGVYPEPVPQLAQSEDEDISEGINRLTVNLHEQALKKKKMLLELEKTVAQARESQQREFERIALNKLVVAAYEKYMACWGPHASSSKNINRATKQAALTFVRRTLARYRKFEETGTSCFSEPPFRDMFLSASFRKNQSTKQSDISLADRSHGLMSRAAEGETNKCFDGFRSLNHLTEQTSGREDQWSNKLKKKELLLDEVVGSATGMLRASPGLGASLVSGTKGKRSERDREGKVHSRDSSSRNGTAKVGRPAVTSNAKGERKNKSKPKQKMAQLSASVNSLLGKPTDTPTKPSPSAPKSRDNNSGISKKDDAGLHSSYSGLQDEEENIDFSNLQLPEMDVTEFGSQGQDIGSWLSIEEDGMQDHDFMGLEIPMDDLSEVNMMF